MLAILCCPVERSIACDGVNQVNGGSQSNKGGESFLVIILHSKLSQVQTIFFLPARVDPEIRIIKLIFNLLGVDHVCEGLDVTIFEGLNS